MSSSLRTVLSATVVAGVAIGGLLVPVAASAAPASPKTTGLNVTVSDVVRDTVTRGQGEDSLTITVTNTGDTPQPYSGQALLKPTGGPSPLDVGQLRVDVQPLTAPATDSTVVGQSPALVGEFFPHGGTALDSFQVPAGSSYSWKVVLGFAADFPGNDDGLDVDVNSVPDPVHFDLSPALPDGKLTDRFSAPVTVSPGHPGETTLETDNEAGGSFTSPLTTLVNVFPSQPGGDQPHLPGLQLDVRIGDGPWQKATTMQAGSQWSLPVIPAGFTYGQKRDVQLRFTLADDPGNAGGAQDVAISATTWLGSVIASAQTQLHVRPAGAAGVPTTPSSSGTGSAPAPAPGTPTTGATATPDTTAQLAETGAPGSGFFAGLAAVFAAAGVALLAAGRRRRGGHGRA